MSKATSELKMTSPNQFVFIIIVAQVGQPNSKHSEIVNLFARVGGGVF